MEQITVATKLKMEYRLTILMWLVFTVAFSLLGLLIYDQQVYNGLMYLMFACAWTIRLLLDLQKETIKSVVLDRNGITIHRYLLIDVYLPYEKLKYVWNFTFHFRGFDLDTNVFKNQREIIEVINHFRTQGLIKAPERKPVFWEIASDWAFQILFLFSLAVYMVGSGLQVFSGSLWLARVIMVWAMIIMPVGFLIQTIYRFVLRVSNHKSA